MSEQTLSPAHSFDPAMAAESSGLWPAESSALLPMETEALGGGALAGAGIDAPANKNHGLARYDTDAALLQALRDKRLIPDSMHLIATYREDALDEDEKNMASAGTREGRSGLSLWQEQTFGNIEVQTLQRDISERFRQSVEVRKGQEIIDTTTGLAKRPIMDISLEGHSQEQVTQAIGARSAGLEAAIQTLRQAKEAGQSLDQAQCHELLFDNNVLGRKMGNLLGIELDKLSVAVPGAEGESPAGTIADLYIDQTDLMKYAEIDGLVLAVSGATIRSEDRLARGVVNLAGNTFASGTELMHAVPNENLLGIVAQGALATRSQVWHGAKPKTQLNGGFLHSTRPGTGAYEYSHSNHPTVIGIPIDSVVANTPFMQLESNYTGDSIQRYSADKPYPDIHSMQYEMGEVVINDVESAPEAFRAALGTTQQRLEQGMRQTWIAQGGMNNLSFAASGRVESAGAYSYPLSEVHIYTDSLPTIQGILAAHPDKADLLSERTTVAVGYEHAIGYIPLPGLQLNETGGITVYAPVSAREVDFTEERVGNSTFERRLELNLANIDPSAVGRYMNRLIETGLDPHEALAAGFQSVNEEGGQVSDLLQSFIENSAAYEAAGVTPDDIVSGVSPATLAELNPLWLGVTFNGNTAAAAAAKVMVKAYGDRLAATAPDLFARKAAALARQGYKLSTAQEGMVMAFKQRVAAEAKASAEQYPAEAFVF